MSEPILVERDKGIARVYMNRPEAYNAFEQEFLEALAENMVALAVDESVRGIVITGKGKAWRIGLMGYNSTRKTVFRFLGALEQAMRAEGYAGKPGAGLSASEAVYG